MRERLRERERTREREGEQVRECEECKNEEKGRRESEEGRAREFSSVPRGNLRFVEDREERVLLVIDKSSFHFIDVQDLTH